MNMYLPTYLHGEKYTKYQLSSNWNEFSTKMSRSKLKLSLSAPLEILTNYESTKFKTKNCLYSIYLAFPQRMYVHCTSNLPILILIRIWMIIVLNMGFKNISIFPSNYAKCFTVLPSNSILIVYLVLYVFFLHLFF